MGSRTRAHGFQLLGLPPPVPPPARTSLEKPEAFFPLPLLSWLNPGRVVGSLLKALGSRGGGGDPAGGLGVEAVCASFLHPSRLPAPDLGSALPLARCSWVTRSSARGRKAVSMCSSSAWLLRPPSPQRSLVPAPRVALMGQLMPPSCSLWSRRLAPRPRPHTLPPARGSAAPLACCGTWPLTPAPGGQAVPASPCLPLLSRHLVGPRD